MRTLLRCLALAVALIALEGLLRPWVENLVYAIRLGAMPAPLALPVPVAGVTPSLLADTWGGARSGGRKHEGIDIFARRGTPVLAATEGIVMRVGTNRLGGQVVWVLGPGGQRHYYAHLDSYGDVHAGMRIDAGKIVGYVGNTGNAATTPPHLHYGIYTAGGAINPYPFLRHGPTSARMGATRHAEAGTSALQSHKWTSSKQEISLSQKSTSS
ncbi:L-Ala--D-Glu endopeptidase [Massilia sp. Bi118]|uniref:M23 family metallopeptidase n=1 Tax=Massilia sp. Bi118 TaxID=2822346 RepID=UPI001DC9B88C|nr:M23 family metallopeptidase [Massilia sp. Bi118]CAH0282038.1 L-Ala--D-Glu endopeptidase [Massilia sp. Bi118]